MSRGPFIFLGAFLGLALSWYSLVLHPQLQIGRQDQAPIIDGTMLYPAPLPGLVQEGAEVYRANGCNYCHSQQIDISSVTYNVVMASVETNFQDAIDFLARQKPELANTSVQSLTNLLPIEFFSTDDSGEAEKVSQRYTGEGARVVMTFEPHGADLARGWGQRRTVAADYLHERPVMLGSLRAGPDLANVGQRLPDVKWHLKHLYAPESVVPGSKMPPYKYLFETKQIGSRPSPDALQLEDEFAPEEGFEIVPKPEATALVAYLMNRQVKYALQEAPLPQSAQPEPDTTGTNAVNGATNTVPAQATEATPQ